VPAIYLDNNATTRPADAVVTAMVETLRGDWANPSSVHRAGQSARQRVELARESVCRLVGIQPGELSFTSGGTEAANLAIVGTLESWAERGAKRRNVLVTSRVEHSAVRELAESIAKRGGDVRWLDVDGDGIVDCDQLETLLRMEADRIALVSVMWVNNETGVIQPIERIGEACRETGVRFHTDATQIVGKLPVDLPAIPVDLASFAAHKFHGPKGIGALYVRPGTRLRRLMPGGPQERDRRGGTENVAGMVGMGVAADLARAWVMNEDDRVRLETLRDEFEARMLEQVPNAAVNAASANRIWSTSNIAFPGLEAEAILLLLSERGVCASAGSACSSGSLDPSPVLLAMGIPDDQAHGSVRFSLSRETTEDEIEKAAIIVLEVVDKLRAAAV
jgi:cysteine desulfurase